MISRFGIIDNPYKILVRIVGSYFIFILLIIISAHDATRSSSFLMVFICAILSILYLTQNRRNIFNINIRYIVLFGLIVKIIIGYLFWEFYIFPDYFSSVDSSMNFDHREYLMTEYLMRDFAEYRLEYGIFAFPEDLLYTKHVFLHYIMSNLYLSGNFNPFDLSIQNGLFSIYTAVLIAAIVKQLGGSKKQIRLSLILAIYQPFSLISSIIFRDIVGQFFVILAVYLVFIAITRKSTLTTIVLIILASFSAYLQRLIYVMFPIVLYLFFTFSARKRTLQAFILVPIFITLFSYNMNFFNVDNSAEVYGNNVLNANLWIYLPFNLLRLLIGPFPWTNWFDFNDNSIFLVADYFQAVVNLTFIIFSIQFIRKTNFIHFINSYYSLLVLAFIMFMFSALGTKDIHLGYMSIGSVLLIPIVIKSEKKIINTLVTIFIGFILFNIFAIIIGLTGQGIGLLFR